MYKPLRVGLLGCGVVGGGVVEALHLNADHMAKQCGAHFQVVRIAVRDLKRPRTPHVNRDWLCTDWQAVCAADDVDIVVEAMGGIQPAFEAIHTALSHGKHVVSANKELLAFHGEALYQTAADHGVSLLFEASVLGGVPALHALQTYFFANRIQQIRGIVNGTCNYILTRMSQDDVSFGQALVEAQQKGYAEPDPSADIEGLDALYKLQILTRFALSVQVDCQHISRVGIADVDSVDIQLAERCGCRLKHVVQAIRTDDGDITASVGPTLIPADDPLYGVDGVQNALCVSGDLVGQLVFMGPGAGAFPTASAVVEDLVKVVHTQKPLQAIVAEALLPRHVLAPTAQAYLVRRMAHDGHLFGSRYNQHLLTTLGADAVTYVRLPGHHVEGWIVQSQQGLQAAQVERASRDCGPGSVACYPFVNAPNLAEMAARNAV